MLDLTSSLIKANTNLFYLINGINNPTLNYILPIIASNGTASLILILVLLFIFGGNYGRRVTILGLVGLFLAIMVATSLKYLIAEPGPYVALSNVNILIPTTSSIPSFPSGQTASSFTVATVIGSMYHSKTHKIGYWLLYPLLIYASLIGFSLIYSGVHYPIDVICGAVIGILSALIILKYQSMLLNNKIASYLRIK
ncbi:MAG: phosphatase PAP2 family protein [Methanobacterium sp.]|nr:phosphatase PAP2 family protein [Methanobacterium sp.]